jgi:hypothetical protein
MPTVRFVPALDVAEDRQAGLHLGPEAAAVDELALQGREEAFALGPPLMQRHVERVQHQVSLEARRPGPAHDPAAEDVEDRREVE